MSLATVKPVTLLMEPPLMVAEFIVGAVSVLLVRV